MATVTISPLRGCGTYAHENMAVSTDTPHMLRLQGTCKSAPAVLGIDRETIGQHMLILGGTGSGKTNLIFTMADQIFRNMQEDDTVIILDTKGDYYREFKDRAYSCVIGNSKMYRRISEKWNLFRELCADGLNPQDVHLNAVEIARSLFAQRMKVTTNSFFPGSARDILASLLYSVFLDGLEDRTIWTQVMNNRGFSEFISFCSPEELCLQLQMYPELKAAASYIEGDSEQAQGVISELYSVVRELFIGVFAENGDFSIREFLRRKGKKVLFLEYDLSIGSVLTPIYRLLIDLAFKEILGQGAETNRNVYFILDEFKLLPDLEHMDDAANFGRSKGIKIIAGLQSMDQLYALYGKEKGRSIAAGFSTVVAFRANDPSTMEYVRGLYGKNMLMIQSRGTDNEFREQIQRGNVIEDWLLSGLRKGEAVVCLPSKPPFVMHFKKYSR